MESGVHFSIHPNCHHLIVFVKFNLKIFYLPPLKCEIWHYEKVNIDLICKSIFEFSWEKRFFNTDANQKVYDCMLLSCNTLISE